MVSSNHVFSLQSASAATASSALRCGRRYHLPSLRRRGALLIFRQIRRKKWLARTMYRRRDHCRYHPHRHDRDAIGVFTINYHIIVVTMRSAPSSYRRGTGCEIATTTTMYLSLLPSPSSSLSPPPPLPLPYHRRRQQHVVVVTIIKVLLLPSQCQDASFVIVTTAACSNSNSINNISGHFVISSCWMSTFFLAFYANELMNIMCVC